jgi:hypothetical protein
VNDRVHIVDAESLEGGFDPPSVDGENSSIWTHRRGDLRVLVVADPLELDLHGPAIQAAAASPLVKSLMVLCEANPYNQNLESESSDTQEEKGVGSNLDDSDVDDDEEDAAEGRGLGPRSPLSSGELPWLPRPDGLSPIPILWASGYVGIQADNTGAVTRAGAPGHVLHNRYLLHRVLSSESVFDALHDQLTELPTSVAVPALTLAYDSRLAGQKIADWVDAIIMNLFNRDVEFLAELTGLDADALANIVPGLVVADGSKDDDQSDSMTEATADNTDTETEDRLNDDGAEQQTETGSNYGTPFDARLADLIADADQRARDRDGVGQSLDLEDGTNDDEQGPEGEPTIGRNKGDDPKADRATTRATRATEAERPWWRDRQRAADVARRYIEEQATPISIAGGLLAGLSLLAPGGLIVAGLAAGASLLAVAGLGVTLARRRSGSSAKKRPGSGRPKSSDDIAIDDDQVESDQDPVGERTSERQLREIRWFLGILLLNELVARRQQPFEASIVQYDPIQGTRRDAGLTDDHAEIVYSTLRDHLSDLVYLAIKEVFVRIEGIDSDDDDQVANQEQLQVRREDPSYLKEITLIEPDQPPINQRNKALEADKTTRDRLLHTLEHGHAPNLAIKALYDAAQRILMVRDRIVQLGLVGGLHASREERAEFERRLSTRIHPLTEDTAVLEVIDRMAGLIDHYRRDVRRLVHLCDMDHLPLLDRSAPLKAVAHARPELRDKLDEWTGRNSGIWSTNADLDGIIGLLPVVSGAVHEPPEPWLVANAAELLSQLHGVEIWIDGAAKRALVDQLSRYEVVSALDELLESIGDRRSTARLTCERGGEQIVVSIDGATTRDAAVFDNWSTLKDRIRWKDSSDVARRLVLSLPLVAESSADQGNDHGE